MTENELIELFDGKGFFCGSEFMVCKEYCADFVKVCKLSGFAVIGIEGFYLLEDGVVKANLNEIADFSRSEKDYCFNEYVEQCFKVANDFFIYMNDNGQSNVYCFVLIDSRS